MTTITAVEAKTQFGDLLDRVSKGEEIVIARHEKPIARLIPEGENSLTEVKQAVDDLRALRAEISKRRRGKGFSDREIRSAIEEGRR